MNAQVAVGAALGAVAFPGISSVELSPRNIAIAAAIAVGALLALALLILAFRARRFVLKENRVTQDVTFHLAHIASELEALRAATAASQHREPPRTTVDPEADRRARADGPAPRSFVRQSMFGR